MITILFDVDQFDLLYFDAVQIYSMWSMIYFFNFRGQMIHQSYCFKS